MEHQTETPKALWTAPELETLGTMSDVRNGMPAGPDDADGFTGTATS